MADSSEDEGVEFSHFFESMVRKNILMFYSVYSAANREPNNLIILSRAWRFT